MIKKVFYSILIVCILSLLINTVISAEETGSPYLSESIVNIEVDNNKNYEINQDITISNIHSLEENEITHTLSNINNVEINDLEIKTGDNELEFSFEEKSSFKKYSLLIPDNQDSDFSYQISYKTHLEPDEFTTPLFVPEFSSMGEENVVNINFKAPEGMIIQQNSFPIIKGETGNQDATYLMNLPSHVKYVIDTDKNVFNSFNLIGWGTLVVFGLIVFVWIRSERKMQKGEV